MLTDKAQGLHYAGGQKQTTRVVDAGDDGPVDRDAGICLSAGDAADGSTCVLPQYGADLQFVQDECEGLLLPGPAAESGNHSSVFVFF